MARRVEFTKAGSPSTIRVTEMTMPEPKQGQVRVKVAFAGINFADLLMRLGFYQPRPPYPFTPGYEVSGTIDALGEGESHFTIGQRVVAAMSTGGQSSHVVVDIQRVLPLPEEISLEAAAAMPVTYLTAHHMYSRLIYYCPSGVYETWYCILLNGEVWHPPGVDNIISCN